MPPPPQTIHVVEDDPSVLSSLAILLRTWGYSVACYSDAESFLASALESPADCILLDVKLPEMDGLGLLSELRQRGVLAPIILLTGYGDVEMAVSALKNGAHDFLEKPFDGEDLVNRIGAAINERPAWTPDRHYVEIFRALTPRETQVMEQIVAGYSNKVIAHRLGVSPKTVEVHRGRVMKKTGARSLSDLVRMSVRAGIDPDMTPECD